MIQVIKEETLNLSDSFIDLFKMVNDEKGHLFLTVQKELLKEHSLSIDKVAELLQTSKDEANIISNQFGEKDEQGKIVAFAGLSLIPTNHSFRVDFKQFYTWCAADAIIFPQLLGVPANIQSKDPITGEEITLSIWFNEISRNSHKDIYISWVDKIDQCDIRNSMCNRTHFFSSKNSASQWQEKNTDARIFSVKRILKQVTLNEK